MEQLDFIQKHWIRDMKTIRNFKKDTFLTKHHLIPKARNLKGTYKAKNILMLWRDNHNYWHILFHNLTIQEILRNWKRLKFNENVFKKLFKEKTKDEAYKLLLRMYQIKKSL